MCGLFPAFLVSPTVTVLHLTMASDRVKRESPNNSVEVAVRLEGRREEGKRGEERGGKGRKGNKRREACYPGWP